MHKKYGMCLNMLLRNTAFKKELSHAPGRV